MKAIRGATTVNNDTASEIKEAVNELLNEIKIKNSLTVEDFICILFSNTNDLHSFYPAKAAREAGYFSVPLYSSLEPEIDGALKKCIRVMVLAETDENPVHVYQNKASSLRKDLSEIINIAIDGPAGSGKSTVAKIIADKLNILCLDTGAMYRACALKCLNESVDVTSEKTVEKLIADIDIKVEFRDGRQITCLDGKNVSDEIRTDCVSMSASTVSSYGCVRNKMVELQRKIAKSTSCVLDGRDIGTNVLPDAKFKFYLTAKAEVRAKRRTEDNVARGYKADYNEILSEIIKRDYQDKTRKIAPLKIAADAVVVDTSDMNIDEVVSHVLNKIQERI